jgi:hypothetical protein
VTKKEEHMKIISGRRNVWVLALAAALGAGCSDGGPEPGPTGGQSPGGNSEPTPGNPDNDPSGSLGGPVRARSFVTGVVLDAGAGLVKFGLAGKGTLDAAVKVRLSKVLAKGGLEVLAEGKLSASGEFKIAVPLNVDLVVAHVLDANGKILGGGILGASGKVNGEVVVMAPIDIETSLELAVLLELGGCDATTIASATQARAMIDAKIAADLGLALNSGIEAHVAVEALVRATLLAGKVQAQIVASAGVDVDVELLAKAQLDALAKLNVGLNAAAR